MSLKNSTTKLSEAPQDPRVTVNLAASEYNTLSLNIPRARALADVIMAANEPGAITEPASTGECVALLWEILERISSSWGEAQDREIARKADA